jgi:hypothetical protein
LGIQIFQDVMLCLWVSGCQWFEGSWCLHSGSSSLLGLIDPEDEGTLIV